jgi:hypothetical protein
MDPSRSRSQSCEGQGGPGPIYNSMDQISIKTPNPKCRLYWCSIEFTDRKYSQSRRCLRPLFCELAPLYLLIGSLIPPPPLPCVNKYRGMYSSTTLYLHRLTTRSACPPGLAGTNCNVLGGGKTGYLK